MKKMYLVGISLCLTGLLSMGMVHYNKETNSLEFITTVEVTKSSDIQISNATLVFTPVPPYDGLTMVITAPKKVCLGQEFEIDFAIQSSSNIYLSFWADLIPDPLQNSASGLAYIAHDGPTIGTFTTDSNSVAYAGGCGSWNFSEALEAHSNNHLRVTLKAGKAGVASYKTIVATNPPAYVGPVAITVTNSGPVAVADTAQGYKNKPLVIAVLDNDYADSPLDVIAVTQPDNGYVTINNDNTLTYVPHSNFIGPDSFMYTVADAGNKTASARVSVTINDYFPPAIVQKRK